MTRLSVCREGGEGGRGWERGKEGGRVREREGGRESGGRRRKGGGGREGERGKIHHVCKCLLVVLFEIQFEVYIYYSEC